jgi:hypothetical protein
MNTTGCESAATRDAPRLPAQPELLGAEPEREPDV